MSSGKRVVEENMDSCLGPRKECACNDSSLSDTEERDSRKMNRDVMALKSLLTDCGSTSVLNLRWVISSAWCIT